MKKYTIRLYESEDNKEEVKPITDRSLIKAREIAKQLLKEKRLISLSNSEGKNLPIF